MNRVIGSTKDTEISVAGGLVILKRHLKGKNKEHYVYPPSEARVMAWLLEPSDIVLCSLLKMAAIEADKDNAKVKL